MTTPHRRFVVWTATLILIAFLTIAFFRMSCGCDMELYHHYAGIAERESLNGLYQHSNVEYPPLAIGFIVMTERFSAHLPEIEALQSLSVYKHPTSDYRHFKMLFRLEMVLCTLLIWWIVVVLLYRNFSQENSQEWTERLLAFTVCLAPLGYVLLDRFDILLAALMLAALLLLSTRLHYCWSLGVLAVAIAFKFVPIVLVPVWLLATQADLLSKGLGSVRSWGQFLAGCVSRVAVLTGFLVVCILPIWFFTGNKCLAFLNFHAARGIEFQSNYAAGITFFKHFGYPVKTTTAYGSAILDCSVATLFMQVSAVLVAVSLLGGVAVLFLSLTRQPKTSPAEHPDVSLVTGHVLWALLATVLFNKTFSPQYLLWLVPLVILVPLAGSARRYFHACFFGAVYLTLFVFPRHFREVVGSPLPDDPSQTTGATAYGTGLLLLRFLFLCIMAAILARHLLRQVRTQEALQVKAPPVLNHRAA